MSLCGTNNEQTTEDRATMHGSWRLSFAIASVEASKVKGENLELARGKWRSALCFTGLQLFSKVIGWGMFTEIFLRELDLALLRPFCYSGLCNRRQWLLQQRWLISICLFLKVINCSSDNV